MLQRITTYLNLFKPIRTYPNCPLWYLRQKCSSYKRPIVSPWFTTWSTTAHILAAIAAPPHYVCTTAPPPRRHRAGRLLPLYLHFAQAATTIYWLAHHYRSVLQRRTDKHSRLRLEHSSAACVNCSALGETLVNQLGATYRQSFQFLTSFLTTT